DAIDLSPNLMKQIDECFQNESSSKIVTRFFDALSKPYSYYLKRYNDLMENNSKSQQFFNPPGANTRLKGFYDYFTKDVCSTEFISMRDCVQKNAEAFGVSDEEFALAIDNYETDECSIEKQKLHYCTINTFCATQLKKCIQNST